MSERLRNKRDLLGVYQDQGERVVITTSGGDNFVGFITDMGVDYVTLRSLLGNAYFSIDLFNITSISIYWDMEDDNE